MKNQSTRATAGKTPYRKQKIWLHVGAPKKQQEISKEAAVLLTPNSAKINTDKLVLSIYKIWLIVFAISAVLIYLLRK